MKRILVVAIMTIVVISTLLFVVFFKSPKNESETFSIAPEVAPVLDFWTTYTNDDFFTR